jgi:uncharacterized phiE125 gp8 family phage protein
MIHLYRPIHWARGDACIASGGGDAFSPYAHAILVRLKLATFIPSSPLTSGVPPMRDDRSSSLRLVTAPLSEPITLAQAKTFLRIEHAADDEPITRAITAARQAAEQYLRLALLTQTWDYAIANPCSGWIALPVGPAQSVVSVTLTAADLTTSVVAASNYRLSVDGCALQLTPSLSAEKLAVRYIAGMATSIAEIPPTIIQGMLHHLSVLMENREGEVALPMQAIACYQPYRRVSL